MAKISLSVFGRKMGFTKVELANIVENYICENANEMLAKLAEGKKVILATEETSLREISLNVFERNVSFGQGNLTAMVEWYFINMAKQQSVIPEEGHWYDVDPTSIGRSIFAWQRGNVQEEWVRTIIQDAFKEMDAKPKTYGRKFQNMYPKKEWDSMTVSKMAEMPKKEEGTFLTNWVFLALEWAQRIEREGWDAVCKHPDRAQWFRLIVWKDLSYRLSGGSAVSGYYFPAASIDIYTVAPDRELNATVPSKTRYK